MNKALNIKSATISSKNLTNQMTELISTSSISLNTLQSDGGLWLIVIVFSYVFGLFLIFVIIWFIWYGVAMKKRRNYLQANLQTSRSNSGSRMSRDLLSSGSQFMQYDYSTNSTLNRQSQNSLGLGQISKYSPGHVRNNPAFNHSESSLQKKYSDDLSTNSFVHTYNKYRI